MAYFLAIFPSYKTHDCVIYMIGCKVAVEEKTKVSTLWSNEIEV